MDVNESAPFETKASAFVSICPLSDNERAQLRPNREINSNTICWTSYKMYNMQSENRPQLIQFTSIHLYSAHTQIMAQLSVLGIAIIFVVEFEAWNPIRRPAFLIKAEQTKLAQICLIKAMFYVDRFNVDFH